MCFHICFSFKMFSSIASLFFGSSSATDVAEADESRPGDDCSEQRPDDWVMVDDKDKSREYTNNTSDNIYRIYDALVTLGLHNFA